MSCTTILQLLEKVKFWSKTVLDQSLLAGGAMQLVAAASEPKFLAAGAGGSGAGAGVGAGVAVQEPKFAPFPLAQQLAVSTTGSHETHQQQKGKNLQQNLSDIILNVFLLYENHHYEAALARSILQRSIFERKKTN